MNNLKNIKEILDLGTSEEKIKILESLSSTDNIEIIQKIISKLDDDDIQVRGEAFSSLVLNENNWKVNQCTTCCKHDRGRCNSN